MYQGGCECGFVRYQFRGEPLTCYACHCTDCQSASGSAFSLSMLVQREDIQITSGEEAQHIFTMNHDQRVRHHCGQCGAALWYGGAEASELVALKAGTFDDTSWFQPIAHVWVRSAQAWFRFDSNVATYETQPDISDLLQLWQARK